MLHELEPIVERIRDGLTQKNEVRDLTLAVRQEKMQEALRHLEEELEG